MRETFVVGNWKMNGSRETNAPRLTRLASGWHAVAGRTLAVATIFRGRESLAAEVAMESAAARSRP